MVLGADVGFRPGGRTASLGVPFAARGTDEAPRAVAPAGTGGSNGVALACLPQGDRGMQPLLVGRRAHDPCVWA
jgi:hypothetical protein